MFAPESTRIGFIGAGRLAASLAVGLRGAGYCVASIASSKPEAARTLALAVTAEVATTQVVADTCDLVFVTVPDSAIAAVARQTSWRREQAVVHCSGALGLEVLSPATDAGAQTGCFHPLQSFPAREGDATRFQSITCGIEAADDLSMALERIAGDLGADVVRLEGIDRARYHAAAVFVSNYVVSLMASAAQAWEQAGLPQAAARAALAPLLLGAAKNVAEHELAEALTGPVTRGDVATVERHLAALEDPQLRELYRRLGAELLTLGLHHTPEVSAQLRALLGIDAS
jgi:predicted short-subunit dehydrogenase-like oxidoreductase (DUF2520 family)